MKFKISLDQWRAFVAVVEHGGYAQAATALHLSQSTVSYAVARLQELLEVRLLAMEGRKAKLTAAGEALLPRARHLLREAGELEQTAAGLAQGWEGEITLAVDVLCPVELLLTALARFEPHSRGTRIVVREEVLSGTDEALQQGRADLGIHSRVPSGCSGAVLMDVEFVPVSHPEHELQRLDHPLELGDLARAVQIFIRDTGAQAQEDGHDYSCRRWTVSSRETALELLLHGFGFCWTPYHWVETDLAAGRLQRLPLPSREMRRETLYLVFPRSGRGGPATRLLAECFTDQATLQY